MAKKSWNYIKRFFRHSIGLRPTSNFCVYFIMIGLLVLSLWQIIVYYDIMPIPYGYSKSAEFWSTLSTSYIGGVVIYFLTVLLVQIISRHRNKRDINNRILDLAHELTTVLTAILDIHTSCPKYQYDVSICLMRGDFHSRLQGHIPNTLTKEVTLEGVCYSSGIEILNVVLKNIRHVCEDTLYNFNNILYDHQLRGMHTVVTSDVYNLIDFYKMSFYELSKRKNENEKVEGQKESSTTNLKDLKNEQESIDLIMRSLSNVVTGLNKALNRGDANIINS